MTQRIFQYGSGRPSANGKIFAAKLGLNLKLSIESKRILPCHGEQWRIIFITSRYYISFLCRKLATVEAAEILSFS